MFVVGCVIGVINFSDLDLVGRFVIEVVKLFGRNKCDFYDKEEWEMFIKRYGKLNRF